RPAPTYPRATPALPVSHYADRRTEPRQRRPCVEERPIQPTRPRYIAPPLARSIEIDTSFRSFSALLSPRSLRARARHRCFPWVRRRMRSSTLEDSLVFAMRRFLDWRSMNGGRYRRNDGNLGSATDHALRPISSRGS